MDHGELALSSCTPSKYLLVSHGFFVPISASISHAIAPRYQAFSKKYTNVVFTEVDVDKAQDVARKFGVSAMPTFIFLKNGAQVDSVRGANPQGLEAAIQKHSTDGAAAGSSAFSGKGQTLSGSNVSKEAAGPSPVDFSAITNMDPQVQILLALVGM